MKKEVANELELVIKHLVTLGDLWNKCSEQEWNELNAQWTLDISYDDLLQKLEEWRLNI